MNLDEDRLAALQSRFVASLTSLAVELERCLQKGELEAARQLAHSLAGRSGMFGFSCLGDTARAVDEAPDHALRNRAERLLVAIRAVGLDG